MIEKTISELLSSIAPCYAGSPPQGFKQKCFAYSVSVKIEEQHQTGFSKSTQSRIKVNIYGTYPECKLLVKQLKQSLEIAPIKVQWISDYDIYLPPTDGSDNYFSHISADFYTYSDEISDETEREFSSSFNEAFS